MLFRSVSQSRYPPCPAPVSSPFLSELDSLVESITGQIKNEWTTFFNGSGACKYGLDSLDTMPVLLSKFYRIHNTFLPESYCLIPSEFFSISYRTSSVLLDSLKNLSSANQDVTMTTNSHAEIYNSGDTYCLQIHKIDSSTIKRGQQYIYVEHPYTAITYTRKNTVVHDGATTNQHSQMDNQKRTTIYLRRTPIHSNNIHTKKHSST